MANEIISGETILVDTNIWHYAYFEPDVEEYKEIHKTAKKFLDEKLDDDFCLIAISLYQIGEIIELFRKTNIDKEIRLHLIESFKEEKFILHNFTQDIINESLNKSTNSNIHVYDYFVVLPVKDIIDKIYSADDHLQHEDFKSICEVINPLKPWILREGRKPKKQL